MGSAGCWWWFDVVFRASGHVMRCGVVVRHGVAEWGDDFVLAVLFFRVMSEDVGSGLVRRRSMSESVRSFARGYGCGYGSEVFVTYGGD